MNDAQESFGGSDEPGSISILVERWNQDENAVVERLASEYFPRLRGVSQRVLGRAPGARADADDVVQSAMLSFCRYMRKQETPLEIDRGDVWRLLCHFAVCKARRKLRKQTPGRPDAKLNPLTDLQKDTSGEPFEQLLGHISTNDFDVHLADALQRLEEPLPQIALLLLAGHSQGEIAEMLNCSRRTIIRKVDLLKRSLADFANSEVE